MDPRGYTLNEGHHPINVGAMTHFWEFQGAGVQKESQATPGLERRGVLLGRGSGMNTFMAASGWLKRKSKGNQEPSMFRIRDNPSPQPLSSHLRFRHVILYTLSFWHSTCIAQTTCHRMQKQCQFVRPKAVIHTYPRLAPLQNSRLCTNKYKRGMLNLDSGKHAHEDKSR